MILSLCFTFGARLAAETLPFPEAARPYGMGNAFSAVANDVNSIFFNPAGLSTVKQIEVAGNGVRTLTGESPKTDLFAAAAVPLNFYKDSWGSGTAGFHVHTGGGSGENSVSNFGISAGAAPREFLPSHWSWMQSMLKISERLHMGGTLRLRRLTHGITGGTAYGLGMDLGFLYQFEDSVKAYRDGWAASLVFQEMNTGSIGGGSAIRLGTAWRSRRYTVSLDMVTRENVTRFMPGVEASFFKKLLLLRAGTGTIPGRPRHAVVGLGTLLPPIELDLAYGFPYKDFDQPNDRVAVSFTYRFGTPLLGQYLEGADKRNSAEAEMSLANLEYKKNTLDAAIRENRGLYEKIDADLKKTREKTNVAVKDLEAGEKKLAEQKERIILLNKTIGDLEVKRTALEDQIKKYKALEPELGRKVFKHTVAQGDTLRSLAEKYYGDANKWTVIFDANRDKIKRGVLQEGEELIVP